MLTNPRSGVKCYDNDKLFELNALSLLDLGFILYADDIKHYSGQVHGRPEYNLYYGQPITADLAA